MNYYGVQRSSTSLLHYGIKGMKWGVRRTLEQLGHKDSNSLTKSLKQIKYKEFSKLKSPEEVAKTKSGSCHDQVMYEMSELRKRGINPKATFVIEYDDNGQGGMTHSFVHYKNGKKITWLENAWSERAGIKDYNSLDSIKREIKKAHKSGEFGDKKRYKHIAFGTFDDREHRPGESLQELVTKCMRTSK